MRGMWKKIHHRKQNRGYTLIEALVALFVVMVFVMGVFSMLQLSYRITYQSRIRIVETGILNEQIEIARNLSYDQLGIVQSIPSGVLTRIATTTRNGMQFTITRTVRNIDDPFDGVIGGTPNDISPADMKQIQIDVVCTTCFQQQALSSATTIAPRFLEGGVGNGALFLRVFNATADAVSGASVHVYATSTTTTIDMYDSTDEDGFLRLVDMPAGQQAYHISIDKPGYTWDGTLAPSSYVVSPIRPPLSVVSSSVTEASFFIDQTASLSVETISASCDPVGLVSMKMGGTKLIGTEPDVLLVTTTIATNGSGVYATSTLVWDTYALRVSGYDFLGSIGSMPFVIQPGSNNAFSVLVGSNTGNSLVVVVEDAATGFPVSNATVQVTGTGYDESVITGVGVVRQTDWSGGSGYEWYSSPTTYASNDGHITVASGDVVLRQIGQSYDMSGELISSIMTLATTTSYTTLSWEPWDQPVEAGTSSVRFQLATSNTSTVELWNYAGPDGTAGTYYTATSSIIASVHEGDRYMRYKMYLSTLDQSVTPTVSDVRLTYTTGCTPPGQAYFPGLVYGDYTVIVTRNGYQTMVDTVSVDSDIIFGATLPVE